EFEGAKPLAAIAATLSAPPQSSLLAIVAWSAERTSRSVGSPSGLAMPAAASEGPRARTMTVFAAEPPMMKPPIMTSLPVSTCPRVEMPNRRTFGAGGGVWLEPNVAVAVTGAVTATVQLPVPEQAPLQPRNVFPASGTAARVTFVPNGYCAEQLPLQLMPAGVLVMRPPPTACTESVGVMSANDAETLLLAWITRLQMLLEPLQAPPHPVNAEPGSGLAANPTGVPAGK